MDEEEVKKAIANAITAVKVPLDARIEALETDNKALRMSRTELENDVAKRDIEIKNLKEADAKREADARKASVQMKREAVKAVFEQAVKDKMLTPGQRDAEYTLLNLSDDNVAVRLHENIDALKEKYKKPDVKDKKQNFKSKEDGDTARSGSDSDLPDGRTHANIHEEIQHRITELRNKNPKIGFADAKRQVFQADKELARDYFANPDASKATVGGN